MSTPIDIGGTITDAAQDTGPMIAAVAVVGLGIGFLRWGFRSGWSFFKSVAK